MNECKVCQIEKDLSEFSFRNDIKKYRTECKKCRTNREKAKYKENPEFYKNKKKDEYNKNKEVILERNKKYRANNLEKYNAQCAKYREENRELIRERQKSTDYKIKRNANLKRRREIDSKFRLVCSYRARVSELLKSNKKCSRIQFLDCTKDFFYEWIKTQFNDKMNWENYNEYWVLDHVIPIAFFDLENEIHLKKCFSWFNLRPLEKKENSKKSNFIDLNIIKKHQEIIDNYGYQGYIEIYDWLRNELKYGKNPCRYMDNQQPSS